MIDTAQIKGAVVLMKTDIAKPATEAAKAALNMSHDDFLNLVYLPVSSWLLGVALLFALLLYKYTFRVWTVENPNPYAGETFGMPRGVFRGVITLTLLFAVVLFEVINIKVGGGFEEEIGQLLVAFQMMIAFYFGAKVMHHVTNSDLKKTTTISENMVAAKAVENKPAAGGDFNDPDAAG